MKLRELCIKHNKRFEKIYIDNQINWDNLVNEIYFNNFSKNFNRQILISVCMQRNPYFSNLYEFYCSLLLIKQLLEENIYIGNVEVEFQYESEILKSIILQYKNPQITVSHRHGFLITKFIAYFIKIKSVFIFLLKSYYSFKVSLINNKRKYTFSQNTEYSIIETFTSTKQIKSKKVNDRFYGNKFDDFFDLNDDTVFFVNEVEYWKLKSDDLNWLFNTSLNKMIFKFDLIKFTDFFRVIKEGIFFNIKFSKIKIGDIDLSICFKEEHRKVHWKFMFLLYNYHFYKRLSKQIKLNSFIDWWENQPLDKITIYSIRNFFPRCTITGVISYIIDLNFNFYIKPAYWETKSNLLPHKFKVWSLFYTNFLLNLKIPNLKIEVLKSSRFSYLKNKPAIFSNNKNILVLLPILEDESVFILNTIKDILKSNHLFPFQIHVKTHPMLNESIQLNYQLYMKFINDDFVNIEKNYAIIISSISSIIFESVLIGKFVIIHSNHPFVQSPGSIKVDSIVKTNNITGLLNAFEYFKNIDSNILLKEISKQKKLFFNENQVFYILIIIELFLY
jgi:hypothetical protein